MISFFNSNSDTVIAVEHKSELNSNNISALEWLFCGKISQRESLEGIFVGPRKEMITPWSTNAVEITQNMNIEGISRIEEFFPSPTENPEHDKMLSRVYDGLDQKIFKIERKPEPIVYIGEPSAFGANTVDFETYNQQEGLALNKEEIEYLKGLSRKLGRPLTDSEVFGFSQVNSEHCRHKIFNGIFVIDGKEMESSLFKMIKRTSQDNPNLIVSAYKDNCAFLEGPTVKMFHPASGSKPDFFVTEDAKTVISLKAETHNFPTTVEPFNGAATGTGGEIRDRMAGGKGSFPIAGTAVYMTSYPRFDSEIESGSHNKACTIEQEAAIFEDSGCRYALNIKREWEKDAPRKWLYQTPQEILTKASNGASDFGNKFGQCIICGSLYTFEHNERLCSKSAEADETPMFGYDKVIMLAGGVGYAKKDDALKERPGVGDKVVILGGDNYRIGMGGGAVSSVNTGQYNNAIELNAVQRANPEMQKRVYNAIRAISESGNNTIISVHDHGAGGHLNCLSELVEETGGDIDISKLPIGDPTLSLKEIIGNESQERMGLVMKEENLAELKAVAERERAPFYQVGQTTGNHNFTLKDSKSGQAAIDLQMSDMFGSAPKTYMHDVTSNYHFAPAEFESGPEEFRHHLSQVLQLENVACKDWLTNKVDRSVTGLIAGQQCAGEIQLPLNNLGVTAIGYDNKEGIATSIGHAPAAALIDSGAGSRLSVAEALTNVVWAPLKGGIKAVSLSANWMWPSRNKGEDARLYGAVKAVSDFAVALGINIPTGKDSMSMTQKYPDGSKVLAPGTLIISSVAPVEDINNIVRPNASNCSSTFIYIPFVENLYKAGELSLGGSAFAQALGFLDSTTPDILSPEYFANSFAALQEAIRRRDAGGESLLLAGHDISAGGLITTLLEMNFANTCGGLSLDLSVLLAEASGNACSSASAGSSASACSSANTEASGNAECWKKLERALFAEYPGAVVQVAEQRVEELEKILASHNVKGYRIAQRIEERVIRVNGIELDIDLMRDIWYKTSYLMEIRQSGAECARERYQNYKKQPLRFSFPKGFTGRLEQYATSAEAPVAAIIREKGSNGDREMAWALHLAGFRVKDVHMTDLVSGRETLEEVKMIVFVGGFSNSDTLGSAKGWAGAFLYNDKAKAALDNFYARKDTMSLGICNGCQLMAELGLITPEKREESPKMKHNLSGKFESCFTGVHIEESPSIMLKSLQGSSLGIWVAHGEGRFSFPGEVVENGTFANAQELFRNCKPAVTYCYNSYPGNPNGSPMGLAGVCSADGRHLAMMPHPERCLRPWNWAYYPGSSTNQVSPWIEMFVNARNWCQGK